MPIAGFTKGRCLSVGGDRVDHELRWEGASAEHYVHNAVSLRLEYTRGEIYNIHWR